MKLGLHVEFHIWLLLVVEGLEYVAWRPSQQPFKHSYIMYFSAASILARAISYVLSVFIVLVLISNYQPKL